MGGVHWKKIGEGHAFLIWVGGRVHCFNLNPGEGHTNLNRSNFEQFSLIHKSIMGSFNDSPLGQTVWYDLECRFSLAVLSVDLYAWPVQIVGMYSIRQISSSLLVFAFFTWVAVVIPKQGLVGRAQQRAFIAEPEASLHLHECHLTAAFLVVILLRGGRPVRAGHSTISSQF